MTEKKHTPTSEMPIIIYATPYTPAEKDRGTYGKPFCACCEPVKYVRLDAHDALVAALERLDDDLDAVLRPICDKSLAVRDAREQARQAVLKIDAYVNVALAKAKAVL